MSEVPNIIDVIRMYRKERDATFEQAKAEAVKQFDKHGWPVPESIRKIFSRNVKPS